MEEIEAGRELDALIEAEVMGGGGTDKKPYWMHIPLPAYSTTYEGMGLVLERMTELWHWDIVSLTKGGFRASFGSYRGDADTLPHAVCLAALKAVRNGAS